MAAAFKTPPKRGRCTTPSSHVGLTGGLAGKSSQKRKLIPTLGVGSQTNKIFRYLQPKRLIGENQSINTEDSIRTLNEDKENNFLELRVVLSRIDDCVVDSFEVSNCSSQEHPLETEPVVRALDSSIQAYFANPYLRLRTSCPPCAEPGGCQHIKSEVFTVTQETLFCTMVNSDLSAVMVSECLNKLSANKFPSASMVHKIFEIMQVSADLQTLHSCERLLQRLLYFHPPCSSTRLYYISVLHKPNEIAFPKDCWKLMTCEVFEKVVSELEKCIENQLSPAQLKENQKITTVRKISKPSRFQDSPSPVKRSVRSINSNEIDLEQNPECIMHEQAKKRRLHSEAALKNMKPEEKTHQLFLRFKIMVDILEHDLIVWLSKHPDPFSAIRDRTVCPLVVLALWKPSDDTGFDSSGCRRIFSMYASSWILKFHPKHLKTLSRLISLISEVTVASDPVHQKTYPLMGDRCENIARKLTDVLRNCLLEDVAHEAVLMLKPAWLQMLITASLLGIPPSLSEIEPTDICVPDKGSMSAMYVVFLLSAVATYHIKEADKLLRQASQLSSNEEDSHESLTPCPTINYKILFDEIVAFYEFKSKFLKNYKKIQHFSFFHLLKELLC